MKVKPPWVTKLMTHHMGLANPVFNLTECLLYNATYDVDFNFRYTRRSRQVSISAWHSTISYASFTNGPQTPEECAAAS